MLLFSLLASEFIRVAASRRFFSARGVLAFVHASRQRSGKRAELIQHLLAMVDVNAGSAAALELALLDVPQLTSYARRVIVQQRPFATFADMAKRVNAGLPPTSRNRLPAKLAKHFRFDDGGARERNAEYGRELVGLNIHIPWSAWDGYPVGSGFETGLVWEYIAQPLGRFVVSCLCPPSGARSVLLVHGYWARDVLTVHVVCTHRTLWEAHLARGHSRVWKIGWP